MSRFLVWLFACTPLAASAGGFETQAVGQKALGMGGAFSAVAGDASAVYYNPGALGFLESRISLSAGGSYFLSHTSFLGLYDGQVEAPDVSTLRLQGFGAMQVNEKISFGLGLFSPFGYHVRWDDGWEGRYVAQESRLAVYTVSPVVSYKLNEKLGLGAGLLYSFGKWEQRRAVPAGDDDGTLNLEGKGAAIGFKAGLLFALSEDLKAALTYRSAQQFKIDEGEYAYASLPGSVAPDYPVSGSYRTELHLPAAVTAGIAYRFTEELLTTIEIAYTQWSGLDSVEYVSSADSAFGFARQYRLENALSGRVGAQYAFTDAFTLRGGFGYDVSPHNSSHLLPEMPDANKILFTLGAGWRVNGRLSVDATVGLENYFERQGSDQWTLLYGTYKTIRYLGGLSVHLAF
jgi:long-chain fatty acid transport protein